MIGTDALRRVMAKSAQGPEDNPNSRHLLSQRRRSCQQGIAVQAGRLAVRGSRRPLSYASANRRGRRVAYPAVCSKWVTLLGNADRANRKP